MAAALLSPRGFPPRSNESVWRSFPPFVKTATSLWILRRYFPGQVPLENDGYFSPLDSVVLKDNN